MSTPGTALERKIDSMLELQNELNSVINKNWITANYPFLRAAFVEAAEALDHHGWKWWKSQTPDYFQLQIELIDILHFYLSDTLVETYGNIQRSKELIAQEIDKSSVIFNNKEHIIQDLDILDLLELLGAMAALRTRSFAILDRLMKLCSLTWDEAYAQYISKNILNLFRQANGYKDGSYIKLWEGEEDNVWLERIIKSSDMESADFSFEVRKKLQEKYASIIKQESKKPPK